MPNLENIINESDSDGNEDNDAHSLDELIKIRYKDDTSHRKELVNWSKVIVTMWLFGSYMLLVGNKKGELGLSDQVLIAMLGTTTANVLGLSYIVLSGYFDKAKETLAKK